MVFFRQPRGGQADHAHVPIFPGHHDGAVAGKIKVFEHGFRLGEDSFPASGGARFRCSPVGDGSQFEIVAAREQLKGKGGVGQAPPAFSRGPSWKAMVSENRGFPSIPAERISAATPGGGRG